VSLEEEGNLDTDTGRPSCEHGGKIGVILSQTKGYLGMPDANGRNEGALFWRLQRGHDLPHILVLSSNLQNNFCYVKPTSVW
jgi:hypothetical protein